MDPSVHFLGSLNSTLRRGRAGWSAVGGMCQPAYIPTGYKLADKRKGETVGTIFAKSLHRMGC